MRLLWRRDCAAAAWIASSITGCWASTVGRQLKRLSCGQRIPVEMVDINTCSGMPLLAGNALADGGSS